MSLIRVYDQKLRTCHSAEATLATRCRKQQKEPCCHLNHSQVTSCIIFLPLLIMTSSCHLENSGKDDCRLFDFSTQPQHLLLWNHCSFQNFGCKVVTPLCSGLLQLLQKASDWRRQNLTDLTDLNTDVSVSHQSFPPVSLLSLEPPVEFPTAQKRQRKQPQDAMTKASLAKSSSRFWSLGALKDSPCVNMSQLCSFGYKISKVCIIEYV